MQAPRLVKAGSEKAETVAPQVKFTNWSLQFKLEREVEAFRAERAARPSGKAQFDALFAAEVN